MRRQMQTKMFGCTAGNDSCVIIKRTRKVTKELDLMKIRDLFSALRLIFPAESYSHYNGSADVST